MPVDGVTGYHNLSSAYKYADLQLVIAGKEIHLRPDDYVGEKPLGKGMFTYNIQKRISGSTLYVDIQTVKD